MGSVETFKLILNPPLNTASLVHYRTVLLSIPQPRMYDTASVWGRGGGRGEGMAHMIPILKLNNNVFLYEMVANLLLT